MTIQPSNPLALEFLKLAYPNGPWVLTAIRTDRKKIDTRTFRPGEEEALEAWLKLYNGDRNIYWSTNPTIKDVTKKAEREDIKEVAYLHVDIDPRAGEDLTAERVRCADLFGDKLPSGVPKPTFVVFSGGGYQGFWKMEQPIPINGDLALAEDAKRYNQQLELLFGGDNCHNIDRIMRLPGTINVPDERKKKKGRVPELATLEAYDLDAVYPLSRFTAAAAPVAQMPAVNGSRPKAQVNIGDVPRLGDINGLDQYGVPDRVKVICVQGKHPEKPKSGDDSRSGWLFDTVCNLLRANVPREVVFAIITDPEFGISESVLELGSGAERYAWRQIDRGEEEIIEPWLREMNNKHFVLENENSKVLVAELKDEPLPDGKGTRRVLSMQSFAAIRDRYLNRTVEVAGAGGKIKKMRLGDAWLCHPRRRGHASTIFQPGGEQVVNGYYNLWQGFGVEPKEGDWSLMQAHIRDVLANGDPASEAYMLNWAAYAVQQAALPAEVALVFKGGHGVGKGVFARSLTKLFGEHGLQVSHPSHLSGRFNSHMRNTCVLYADEAVAPQDKAATSVIKTLLTEPDIQIEGKGANLVTCPNHVKVVMASNEDWVAAVARDDRRFAVFDVAPDKKDNKAYFKPLYDQMDNGGLAAMLFDLQRRDLGDWHPREIPETQARADQKNASLVGFERMYLDWLSTGILPPTTMPQTEELRKGNREQPFVSTTELTEYYKANRAFNDPPATSTAVAKTLEKLGGLSARRGKDKLRGFVMPTLQDARRMWDALRAPGRWGARDEDGWSWTPFRGDRR